MTKKNGTSTKATKETAAKTAKATKEIAKLTPITEQKSIVVLSPSDTSVTSSVMVAAPSIEDLNLATGYIKLEIASVANSFCRIGFKLYEINKNKLFEAAGFKNISEYGEQYLGFKKSSTANYISVCKRFSVKDEKGEPTAILAERFEAFSYTQLSEMLPLPADKLEEIKPTMTAKEIRDAKADEASKPVDEATDIEHYTTVLFDRKLTEKNIDLVIKLLRDNVGNDIQLTVF